MFNKSLPQNPLNKNLSWRKRDYENITKLPLDSELYLSKRQKSKQDKPRQEIRRFNHGLETWENTRERQPVDGELQVTECTQKGKILYDIKLTTKI